MESKVTHIGMKTGGDIACISTGNFHEGNARMYTDFTLTPEERMNRYSLKADRADVIVPAAEIFLTIARVVRAEYIHVPVMGLADGIIDEMYAGRE